MSEQTTNPGQAEPSNILPRPCSLENDLLPYKGLMPYDPEDAEWFYGRDG